VVAAEIVAAVEGGDCSVEDDWTGPGGSGRGSNFSDTMLNYMKDEEILLI